MDIGTRVGLELDASAAAAIFATSSVFKLLSSGGFMWSPLFRGSSIVIFPFNFSRMTRFKSAVSCVSTRVAAVYGITGVTGVEAKNNTRCCTPATPSIIFIFFLVIKNKFSKNE